MRTVRFAGTVSLAVAASLLLSTCGSSTSNVTSLAPTAIAVKRYLGTGLTSGALDTGFGGTGAVFTKIDPSEFEYALAVALQSDGKIIAAGHSVLAGQGVIALVRYNTDGSPDLNFGANGIVRTAVPLVDAAGTAVVMQGTQILVAGSTFVPSTGMTGIVLARYNADGSLDIAGFGGGQGFVSAEIGPGTATDIVALALQGTHIIVAGATSDGNFVLKRYDSAGALDPTFGDVGTTPGTATTSVGASAQTPAIGLQPSSGGIVVAGGALPTGSLSMNAVLVRYSADGVLDTTFGGGTNGGIILTDTVPSSNNFSNAVVVQPDDKIVAAGHAKVNFEADTSDIALVRYNADGTPDTTFGSASNGTVVTDVGAFDNAFSVALQSDLKIVVSGNASVSGITRVAIVRYNPNGSPDTSFNASTPGAIVTTVATGPSGIASGNAVLVQADGGIVVAGYD
ncbi:MAG: delta-60 repeat domain-containing protein [Burkholderiales bacterium]